LILGSDVHIDLIDPDNAQYFPKVYYVTPVTDHPLSKSPIAMDYAARESVSALLRGASVERDGHAERIFVGRRNGYRNLLNMDALRQRLSKMCFRYVDAEALSFAQQVETFSQATVVVGLMGAAMTNTLFCRPTTPVIHLAPRGWIEPFYFDLAAVRGHRYHALYGDIDDTGRPPHLSDFVIDIDLLARFIETL
jgi:capsular polysaccharide biosynthesis protein